MWNQPPVPSDPPVRRAPYGTHAGGGDGERQSWPLPAEDLAAWERRHGDPSGATGSPAAGWPGDDDTLIAPAVPPDISPSRPTPQPGRQPYERWTDQASTAPEADSEPWGRPYVPQMPAPHGQPNDRQDGFSPAGGRHRARFDQGFDTAITPVIPPARSDDGFSFWKQPERKPVAPPPQEPMDARPSAAPPESAPATESRPEEQPEKQPEEQPAKRRRDPYLDNVKFILISLVVTGHSLVPTLSAHSARAAYVFIYTFHMPAFVLISGYLSRNFWHSNAKINKLVDTLLIPYVVVEVGYALLRFALGQKWSLTIIDPAWLNWYLVALVLWRISTPVWSRMRQPLLIAVIIYVVAGFSEISGDFSIDRFFGLLPFYVLGLLLKPEHFDYLNRAWVKVAAVVTLLGAAGVAILISPGLTLKPFYYKNSYAKMDMSWWMGISVRLALLVAALMMMAALFALVPRRETWFTDLGTRTLYAYLLHGIPVLIAKDQGWLSFPWLYGPLGVLAIMTSCFALTILLCLPETRMIFKWVLEPRLTWLYRRTPTT